MYITEMFFRAPRWDAGADGEVGTAIDAELAEFRVHALEMGRGIENRRLTDPRRSIRTWQTDQSQCRRHQTR